jgi:hypothetical protein
MAETPNKRAALTPGKAALIGVLAIVLVGVLYWQFSGPTVAVSMPIAPDVHRTPVVTTTAKPPQTTPAANTNKPENRPVVEVASLVDPAAWKSPKLNDVIAYDPFAVPATFPKPQAVDSKAPQGDGLVAAAQADDAKRLAEAVAQLEMQLRELEQRGVQVIVRERDQYAAMIGDRIVHVGDEINGFTVTVIDPTSGVRVERKPAK